MSDQNEKPAALEAEDPRRLMVGVRFHPATPAEQRLYSNFTLVQRERGAVFVDFGFVEPSGLSAVLRAAQAGSKAPEEIGGQLACRVALSIEAAAQLAQQLNQLLRAAQRAQAAAGGRQAVQEQPATSAEVVQ